MPRRSVEKPRNSAEVQLTERVQNKAMPEKVELAGRVHQPAYLQDETGLGKQEPHESRPPAKTVRDHYLKLFILTPVGYFILDEHSLIIDANPAGYRLL